MKPHLQVFGLATAYAAMLRWVALPIIQTLPSGDQGPGLIVLFIGWVICFLVVAYNMDTLS